jgi:hypothetical protein
VKPTPFDPGTDLPPVPFDAAHREAARALKAAGLPWTPHAGCFAWDPEGHMPVGSPFPGRVYFILNLGRFAELLGSREAIAAKLVWLPTWHQARELCRRMGVPEPRVARAVTGAAGLRSGGELLALYRLLLDALGEPAA